MPAAIVFQTRIVFNFNQAKDTMRNPNFIPVTIILLMNAACLAGERPVLPFTVLATGDTMVLHLPDFLTGTEPAPVLLSTAGVEARLAGVDLSLNPATGGGGLGSVTLIWEGDTLWFPLQIIPRYPVEFVWPESDPNLKVTVFGSFNSWNRGSHPLTYTGSDWRRTVHLEPGSYPYRLQVDDEELLDPGCDRKVPNGFGDFNSLLEVSAAPAPELWFVKHELSETTATYRFRADAVPDRVLAGWDNAPLPAAYLVQSGDRLEVRLPRQGKFSAGRHVLRLAVSAGGQPGNTQRISLRNGAPCTEFDRRDAVIYALMVDRFCDGDIGNNRRVGSPELSPKADYYGGDLAGVIQKAREGYFESLGITTLWLSPLYTGPRVARREYPEPHRWFSAYHGYWPVEPRAVDPRYGTLAQLQELAELLHARDQLLLMDFVSHHVYEDHPYFRQQPDWFGQLELPDGTRNLRRWDEYRLTTWFEPFLPSFDFTRDNGAAETLAADAAWWLQEGRLDGFRQDAVKHIPLRFWRILADELDRCVDSRGERPFQIGETFGSYELVGSYVRPRLLDSQFNFNLFYTARRTFLDPAASFADLDRELRKGLQAYGWHNLMGNLIDSHDQVRFMAYADGDIDYANEGNTAEIGWHDPPTVDRSESYDRQAQFLAFVMTIPGIPTLYYGDEIGMTGAADPDNRRPLRFDLTPLERKLFERTARLGQLRREHPALRRGDFHTLLADTACYAVLRAWPGETLLILHNKSDAVQTRLVSLPEHLEAVEPRLLYGEATLQSQPGKLQLELPPRGSAVIKVN